MAEKQPAACLRLGKCGTFLRGEPLPLDREGREGGQNQANPEFTGEADNVTISSHQSDDRARVQAGGGGGSSAATPGGWGV